MSQIVEIKIYSIMKTKFFIILFSVVFALFACNKTEEEVNQEIQTEEETLEKAIAFAQEDMETSALIEEVINEIDLVSSFLNFGLKSSQPSWPSSWFCPSVSIEPKDRSYPKTITIDYGEGCTRGRWGKDKKGKMAITLSASWRDPNVVHTIAFEDFYVDSVQINGEMVRKAVTEEDDFPSQDADYDFALMPTYKMTSDLTLTWSDDKSVTRKSTITSVWTEGSDTRWNRDDDVYHIFSKEEIDKSDGISYQRETTSPLIINSTCKYIVSGIISITQDEEETLTIDYGDGTCDTIATVTSNGKTEEIDLSKRRKHKK